MFFPFFFFFLIERTCTTLNFGCRQRFMPTNAIMLFLEYYNMISGTLAMNI